MKTFLKILLGIAVVIALAVTLAFWATSDLPDAADRFFSRIAAGDYEGALALTTPDFQANTDRAALEQFARSQGIDGYRSASWSSRSIENNVGKLEGTLTVASGGGIPVSVQLVKHDGEWRIQNVRKAEAGVDREPAQPAAAMPAAAEQQALVKATMRVFAMSVNNDDFSHLHGSAAKPFQQQVSVDQLRQAFAAFIEQQIDLSSLDGMQPEISDARVDENGVLRLTGEYATQPSKVSFDFQYVAEAGEWRLIELNVKVR